MAQYRRPLRTVQYVSQYDPARNQRINDDLAQRDQEFKQSYSAMAQEKARQGDIFFVDNEAKEELAKNFNKAKQDILEKYDYKYDQAAPALANLVASERSNPLYALNKYQQKKLDEYNQLKIKFGDNLITNKKVPLSLHDTNGNIRSASDFDYDVEERDDYIKKIKEAGSGIARSIKDGKLRVSPQMSQFIEHPTTSGWGALSKDDKESFYESAGDILNKETSLLRDPKYGNKKGQSPIFNGYEYVKANAPYIFGTAERNQYLQNRKWVDPNNKTKSEYINTPEYTSYDTPPNPTSGTNESRALLESRENAKKIVNNNQPFKSFNIENGAQTLKEIDMKKLSFLKKIGITLNPGLENSLAYLKETFPVRYEKFVNGLEKEVDKNSKNMNKGIKGANDIYKKLSKVQVNNGDVTMSWEDYNNYKRTLNVKKATENLDKAQKDFDKKYESTINLLTKGGRMSKEEARNEILNREQNWTFNKNYDLNLSDTKPLQQKIIGSSGNNTDKKLVYSIDKGQIAQEPDTKLNDISNMAGNLEDVKVDPATGSVILSFKGKKVGDNVIQYAIKSDSKVFGTEGNRDLKKISDLYKAFSDYSVINKTIPLNNVTGERLIFERNPKLEPTVTLVYFDDTTGNLKSLHNISINGALKILINNFVSTIDISNKKKDRRYE